MVNILIGTVVLLIPYIIGAIFTRIADGYWISENIGITYGLGLLLLPVLFVVSLLAYVIGWLVMLAF